MKRLLILILLISVPALAKKPEAIKAPGGKYVRVVGTQVVDPKVAKDTVLGAIEEITYEEASGGMCHAWFDAIEVVQADPDKGCAGRKIADVPEITGCWGKRSCPVKIGGSDDGSGSFIWSVVLDVDCCLVAAGVAEYLGSTIQELIDLPLVTQDRFLKTTGKCKDEDSKDYDCTLSVGDSKADKKADILVPHSWAGRVDLNNVKAKYKVDKNKHEPEDRFPDPVVEIIE